MDKKLQTFLGIMAFYILLTYILFPLGFYFLIDKTVLSAGNGYILGSLVSLALWIIVGRNMIK